MKTEFDHLVVMATSLTQGVEWCQATLGITPGAGGEHSTQGTHNRLFKIATPKFPVAYLEIIAINPNAPPPRNHAHKRWFDMDQRTLQNAVAKGPRLIHFVANTLDIHEAVGAMTELGIDRGSPVAANRRTNKGVLNWQISLRGDGERLFNGTLPTLIQWGKAETADPMRLHPRNTLPRSGVTLQSLSVVHPSDGKLKTAYAAIGLQGIDIQSGDANLVAQLQTPKGLVVLESLGL